MTAWSGFTPFVAMYAADCPSFTIEDACKAAAIEFFTDTRCWRSADLITLTTTVASQAAYTVTPPAGLDMVGLPVAWLGDTEIAEALQRDRGDVVPGNVASREADIKVLVTAADTITLLPPPETAGLVLRATVAYAPSQSSTSIDDAMFFKHRETIRELALANLKRMDGKPWTDPNGAAACQARYDQRSTDASTAAGPLRRNRLRTRRLSF